MNIEDRIEITDSGSIRGYVVFKKADGTVLFAKNNMIVAKGRKYIRELFIRNAFKNEVITSYSDEYAGYKLSLLAFGSNGTATSLSTDGLGSKKTAHDVELTSRLIEIGDRHIVFKGSIIIRVGEEFTLREIGLYLTKDSEDNNNILFSRVVFDPIPLAADDTYSVDYYIYF